MKNPRDWRRCKKSSTKSFTRPRRKQTLQRSLQSYLDRLNGFLKAHPDSPDAPEAIRQIVLVYESQSKTVEADAWRAKVPKEKARLQSGKGK